jgi:uncharacterized protein
MENSLVTDPSPIPAAEPAIPEPAWERLHPNARLGMRIFALLGFALPYLPPAAILLAAWDPPGFPGWAKAVVFVTGLAVVALGGWRYGSARFARTSFALDDAGLRIRRGVVWRSETLVPRSRVQHTDINRGPLDRHFGLATLKVYTAGTKLASVALDGLPEKRALEMRDALVSTDDDAV